MHRKKFRLDDLLLKAEQEMALTKPEIEYLLNLKKPKDLAKLFESARWLKAKYFSNRVFLYGFLYFSTYCRNNCNFCLYRAANKDLLRYRKSEDEILETAVSLAESGVHLLDLTMGEDPEFFNEECKGFGKMYSLLKEIKNQTRLPLMISPGLVNEQTLQEFRKNGVDWYACYQETHNRELFSRLRVGQSYEDRLESKVIAQNLGLLIEEGLLVGVGDSAKDIVDSLEAMKKMDADQVRVMSFVPQQNTPMEHWPTVDRSRELLIIAVMRLVFPDRLIPASLDVDGLSGLQKRLEAGANVITSIIPPMSGLAGVSQSSLDIEEGNRTVESILPILTNLGLQPATGEEYQNWLATRKKEHIQQSQQKLRDKQNRLIS